jgi:hypothetical protein
MSDEKHATAADGGGTGADNGPVKTGLSQAAGGAEPAKKPLAFGGDPGTGGSDTGGKTGLSQPAGGTEPEKQPLAFGGDPGTGGSDTGGKTGLAIKNRAPDAR